MRLSKGLLFFVACCCVAGSLRGMIEDQDEAVPTIEEKWFAAIRNGDIGAVQTMLDQNSDLLKAYSSGGISLSKNSMMGPAGRVNALMVAAAAGQIEVVKKLLDTKKIDVNAVDGRGYNALIYAARSDEDTAVGVAKALLAAGARANYVSAGEFGTCALSEAAYEKHIKVVEELLNALKKESIETQVRIIGKALRASPQNDMLSNRLAEIKGLECPICNAGALFVILHPCGHCFHKDCIEEWFKGKGPEQRTCPLCRAQASLGPTFRAAGAEEEKRVEEDKKEAARPSRSSSRKRAPTPPRE